MQRDIKASPKSRDYINVMESLVAQEVGKQLQDVPVRVRRYLKLEEIVTYALNRLPTLYASSERGWQYQRQLAKRELERQITTVVRQAIAAVQVDPLRLSQPLSLNQHQDAAAVLQVLRGLFQLPDLDWEQALHKIRELQETPPQPTQAPTQPWQPGYRSRAVAWTHRRHRPAPHPEESRPAAQPHQSPDAQHGWDDPRYRL